MIILTPSWNEDNSPFDEYLILEYYTLDGLNDLDAHNAYGHRYPTGSATPGIRLWHVDARLVYYLPTDEALDATHVTTNPRTEQGNVTLMMSNTYEAEGVSPGYLSPLGWRYYNYNLLQLIRNDIAATYRPTDSLETSSLFYPGNTFSMARYSKQFANSGKLNSGNSLNAYFQVDSINDDYAVITIKGF